MAGSQSFLIKQAMNEFLTSQIGVCIIHNLTVIHHSQPAGGPEGFATPQLKYTFSLFLPTAVHILIKKNLLEWIWVFNYFSNSEENISMNQDGGKYV